MTTDETAKAILQWQGDEDWCEYANGVMISSSDLRAMAKLWLLLPEIREALAKHLHKLDFAGADGLGMDETQELRYKLEALEEK